MTSIKASPMEPVTPHTHTFSTTKRTRCQTALACGQAMSAVVHGRPILFHQVTSDHHQKPGKPVQNYLWLRPRYTNSIEASRRAEMQVRNKVCRRMGRQFPLVNLGNSHTETGAFAHSTDEQMRSAMTMVGG